jgi:hypothetical protein
MTGIERIAAERKRQIEEEGFTAEHDDQLPPNKLATAAACYAMNRLQRTMQLSRKLFKIKETSYSIFWHYEKRWWVHAFHIIKARLKWTFRLPLKFFQKEEILDRLWPFDKSWFKSNERLRDLEKAGALIAAEIDRLLRARGENITDARQ